MRSSSETVRFLVSVGWSIYPLGHFLGYLCGSVSVEAPSVVYDIADVINRIAFCLAIWSTSCSRSSGARPTTVPPEPAELYLTLSAVQPNLSAVIF